MKRLILAMAITITTFAASAAENETPAGVAKPGKVDSLGALSTSERSQILAELRNRFDLALSVQRGGGKAADDKFARLVMEADSANLIAASEMPTYQTMMGALQGQALDKDAMVRAIAGDGDSPSDLGSTISDTVFTPLPNGRCRVADSREINSPTVPGVVRAIDVEDIASYLPQGGNGSTAGQGSANCGIPSLTTSLVVSVTVLPLGNDGFFKIFENGKAFSEGNTVLYTGSVGASNDVIVRSCQSCLNELSVYSNSNTHYVIDVIGYFMPPEATALECEDTAFTTTVVLPGANANLGASVCPAGYTMTATNCAANWPMPIVYQSNGLCSARNNGVANETLRASRTCCRVPGR